MDEQLRISDSVTVTTRTYTSIRHLQSAAYFARATRAAENRWTGIGPSWDETGLSNIVANATAAVYTSVAFLEASINELFIDAVERDRFEVHHHWARLSGLRPTYLASLASIYEEVERRTSMMNKYRRALSAGLGDSVALQREEDVARLVTLRNWLTHAKPKSRVVSSSDPELPARLLPLGETVKARFPLNSKWGTASVSTDALLSAGCAEWAIRSVLEYADSFWSALGVRAPYEHVRPTFEDVRS